MKLKTVLKKAITQYNKYRSPEVTATVLSMNEKLFEIQFIGPFCRTCGFYDYFDDLRVLLEDYETRVKIAVIKEIPKGALVQFEVIE